MSTNPTSPSPEVNSSASAEGTRSVPAANFLVNAWRALSAGDGRDSQVALAIATIATVGLIGCVAVIAYGLTSRSCDSGCRVAGGLVGLLAAAGAFSIGGLLGLLFGSPRWGDAPQPVGENGDAAAVQPGGVRPNTSLDRIADWLTTMIVGLGLANLGPIGDKLKLYGVWLTQAITNDVATTNGVPGIVLSLSFLFAGFLLVYLWSLRFLPSELNRAYDRLAGIVTRVAQKKATEVAEQKATEVAQLEVARKTEEIDKKTNEIQQSIEVFRRRPMFAMQPERLQQMGAELAQLGVDVKTREEILARYGSAATWDDEPFDAFGPATFGDYVLTASVRPPVLSAMYEFSVTLKSPDGGADGQVIWLLHQSFGRVLLTSSIEDGFARHLGRTRGPFWVGVVVPRPGKDALRLAINLADAEGVTQEFLDEN